MLSRDCGYKLYWRPSIQQSFEQEDTLSVLFPYAKHDIINNCKFVYLLDMQEQKNVWLQKKRMSDKCKISRKKMPCKLMVNLKLTPNLHRNITQRLLY